MSLCEVRNIAFTGKSNIISDLTFCEGIYDKTFIISKKGFLLKYKLASSANIIAYPHPDNLLDTDKEIFERDLYLIGLIEVHIQPLLPRPWPTCSN